MADPEQASSAEAVDPKLAEAVAAACAPHQAFLDYVKEHRVFVDPDEIAKVQERLREAKEAATAEYAGAVATAAAAARDPRLAARKELSQVPGFNATPTRVIVSGDHGTAELANYQGGAKLTGRVNVSSASHLFRRTREGDNTDNVRGAIVVSDRHNGVGIEYTYSHNGYAVGMEIVVDERLAETQILPAVMGNPGILHEHAARIARNGAGRQHDRATFETFRAAEPTTNDFGPDSVVVFQSQREGAGQYENHFIPLVPITPEAAAVPPQAR